LPKRQTPFFKLILQHSIDSWFAAAAHVACQSSQLGLEQSQEFVSRPTHRLVGGRRIVCGRDRLTTFKSRFHHASLVSLTAFVTVLIAQVNFHSSHLVLKPFQNAFHGCTNMFYQRFTTFNVCIGIDLDFHTDFLQ